MKLPKGIAFLSLLSAFLLSSMPAFALISVWNGHAPVTLENLPKGAAELANLQSRFQYTEGPGFGGGEYTFEYRGGRPAFQKALDALAAVRAPKREVILCDGPGKMFTECTDDKRHVDWTFTVWSPESYYSLHSRPDIGPVSDEMSDYGAPVPPPRIHLYLWKDGRVDWRDIKVPAGVDVVDKRAASAKVKPKDGGLLVGVVYDMSTGRPVPNAEISLEQWRGDPKPEGSTAKTDEDGNFRMEHIQKGAFYIHARADGHARRLAGHFINDGNEYQEETIYLAPTVTLEGKTVDADGKPVAGVKVQLDGLRGIDGTCYARPRKDGCACGTSDESGWFRIPGLPQGYARLMTFGDWRCEEPFRIFPTADQLAQTRGNEIRLTVLHTGEIHGRIIVQPGATLPPNAEVRCLRLNRPSVNDLFDCRSIRPDNSFSQTNLLPGDYLVSIMDKPIQEDLWKNDRPKLDDLLKAIEQAPGTKRVTLEPGGSAEADLVYAP